VKSKIKFALIFLGALYCVYHFKTSLTGGWHFIDNVDLIIHEAGHVVFMPFGEFIAIAGGSLLQLIVPVLFLGYFWRTEQKFSAAAMLLWLSVNFFYIGVYAGDAARMELPLLGGEASTHDWNYLLMRTGLIAQAGVVAGFIHFLGFLSIGSALFLAWLKEEVWPTRRIPISRL
jgi:hypothetical protein